MLRECRRVLQSGGRLAGYVIHTPADLKPGDRQRAAALGPSDVLADAAPDKLARAVGLSIIVYEDVTEEFHEMCDALFSARSRLETQLRSIEGHDVYEEEREKKEFMLAGIREGLLRRCLLVAEAS